jgi:methylated-DNA-[protein]-cysteine S-methyltransferase
MTSATCFADRIPTPLGDVWAVVDDAGALIQLDFEGGRNAPADRRALTRLYRSRDVELMWDSEALRRVGDALRAYFRGDTGEFELEVAPAGSTFQRKVWRELCRIPSGQTISYGELARRVGSPGAARAVGRANATNPVSIVVPCHRVIGTNGTLTGYGGGMERKEALLRHEGALTEV